MSEYSYFPQNISTTGTWYTQTVSNLPDYKPTNTYTGWECPRCGTINGPYIGQCDCKPVLKPMSYPTERCAFDGLPPGVYNLYCSCRKCSPQCGIGL